MRAAWGFGPSIELNSTVVCKVQLVTGNRDQHSKRVLKRGCVCVCVRVKNTEMRISYSVAILDQVEVPRLLCDSWMFVNARRMFLKIQRSCLRTAASMG